MSRIETDFTRLLGIKTPVVSAAMTFAAGPALAAEVTLSGGFGFMAIEFRFGLESFKKDMALARQLLNVPASETLPIGVGAIGWLLDSPTFGVADMLRAALDEKVRAVWLSFGEDLGKWVKFVRSHNEQAGDGRKTLIFVVVGTVEQGIVAVNEWKADVLIAQGSDAGGHGYMDAPSVSVLVTSLLAVLPGGRPPILAAGGIVSGSQLASVLTFGASGAVIGTLLCATPESIYEDTHKALLLSARHGDAIRTSVYDNVQAFPWPQLGINGRALRSKILEDQESGLSVTEVRERMQESLNKGETDRLIVWAGSAVGLVNKIRPVKDVVDELDQSAITALKSASALIV